MNANEVRKRLEVHGRDAQDLVRRIDSLSDALRARSGAILDIKWNGRDAQSVRSASIVYQVPLPAVDSEAPSARIDRRAAFGTARPREVPM